MKKRLLALAMSAAMTTGLLSGCGGGNPDTPAADGGDSANEILVGLIANTTGDAAVYGNSVRNGAMLYIDKINAEGGVNGKQIKIIEYDDKGDPAEAVNAYNRLVSDGITAVIGAVITGTTLAVADEAYEMGMPMITASATAAGVTRLNPDDPEEGIRDNVFRACFIDPFQGEKMAEYAHERLDAKTAAVIYETGNDYAEGVMNAFQAKCEELGITVTDVEAYAKGDVEFKAQLTNIAASNPDVILSPNYYEADGMIVTQARQVGVKGTFLGGDGWPGVKDYADAEALEGSVYCSGYSIGSNPEFETQYEETYGSAIKGMFEPLGYDAAMLMCNALTAAEEQDLTAGTEEYMAAVVQAMKETTGLKGLTGTFSFDEFNDPIKETAIIRWEGGEEVFTEMF